MKRIPLTQGKEALVSDCDYKYLVQWKWSADKGRPFTTYYARRSSRPQVRMHTLVGRRKGITTKPDHIDHNGLNNQRRNLRSATTVESSRNRGTFKNNNSGYKGVSEFKQFKKWRADIGFKNKLIYLGYFAKTKAGKIEAAYAYTLAALRLFKKFACFVPVDHLLDAKTKKRIRQETLQRLAKYGL
jgi:hypothetical protein